MTSTPDELDVAALAERHGLVRTTARPTLPAYVKQLWERRHFILAYAAARTTSTYAQSRIGQLWQVLTPLFNAAVYFFLFGVLLNTSRGVENFVAFLVTGVFIFTFTQRSLNNGAKSISGNLQLVRALHFPRAVLPLSFVLVEFKQLLISMAVLFVIIKATGEPITWLWLLVVPAMALQMLFNIGLSLVMARIGAQSADINQLLPFISRVWFYTSGIFYPTTRFTEHPSVPEFIKVLLSVNPPAVYIDLYRYALIESHNPISYPWLADGQNPMATTWMLAIAWAVVFLIGGFIFFWRREEKYGRG
ncbi:MAG: ABC transporter permease [Pseudonocardiaceae bacterium]